MINNVNDLDQLKYVIEKDPRVVVVNFYANWCSPCIMLSPLLIDMEKFFLNKCLVVQINIERYPKIADAFQVTGMPTTLFFYNNIFWKEMTHVGTEIGTIYQNVNVLLTMHSDGEPKLKKSLRDNPVKSLDSIDYNNMMNS